MGTNAQQSTAQSACLKKQKYMPYSHYGMQVKAVACCVHQVVLVSVFHNSIFVCVHVCVSVCWHRCASLNSETCVLGLLLRQTELVFFSRFRSGLWIYRFEWKGKHWYRVRVNLCCYTCLYQCISVNVRLFFLFRPTCVLQLGGIRIVHRTWKAARVN